MDQRNFYYSMENIDVASKKIYLKILIDKFKLLINGNGNGNGKHYFLKMRLEVLSTMVLKHASTHLNTRF